MIVYKNKLGITCIKPSEGYILTRNGKTFKSVMLGINDRAEFYEEIIDENYVFEEREEVENSLQKDDLSRLKEELIKLSKQKLSDYLETHPLFSKAKYPEGRYYSVNSEHQLRIASQILLYQGNMTVGLDYQLTWNDTGNICEDWSFEELFTLSNEINEYIKPIIKKQQELEILIKNATSKEMLSIIKIDYDNI